MEKRTPAFVPRHPDAHLSVSTDQPVAMALIEVLAGARAAKRSQVEPPGLIRAVLDKM